MWKTKCPPGHGRYPGEDRGARSRNFRGKLSRSTKTARKTKGRGLAPTAGLCKEKPCAEWGLDEGLIGALGLGARIRALDIQTRPAPHCSHQAVKAPALMPATLKCWRSASRRVRLRVGAAPQRLVSSVEGRAAVVRPDGRCARRFEEVIKSLRNCRDFEQSGREVYA